MVLHHAGLCILMTVSSFITVSLSCAACCGMNMSEKQKLKTAWSFNALKHTQLSVPPSYHYQHYRRNNAHKTYYRFALQHISFVCKNQYEESFFCVEEDVSLYSQESWKHCFIFNPKTWRFKESNPESMTEVVYSCCSPRFNATQENEFSLTSKGKQEIIVTDCETNNVVECVAHEFDCYLGKLEILAHFPCDIVVAQQIDYHAGIPSITLKLYTLNPWKLIREIKTAFCFNDSVFIDPQGMYIVLMNNHKKVLALTVIELVLSGYERLIYCLSGQDTFFAYV